MFFLNKTIIFVMQQNISKWSRNIRGVIVKESADVSRKYGGLLLKSIDEKMALVNMSRSSIMFDLTRVCISYIRCFSTYRIVCVCVCVSARVYVCMHVYMSVCVCMYVTIIMYVYVCMCVLRHFNMFENVVNYLFYRIHN